MARSRGTWSADTARSMAIRAVEARKLRGFNRPAKSAVDPVLTLLEPPADPAKAFDLVTLHRVRACVSDLLTHLERMGKRKKPRDFAQVDRLASALERLAELERKLDGRPLPGSRRPAPEPSPGRMARTIAPPVARPAPRPTPAPPSPTADDSDDDPPLQPAPLD